MTRAAPAALTAVFGTLTLAGFGGGLAWYLDLANHFRVQYAVILGACAVVAALIRRVAVAGVALALAVVNLAVVSPLWDEDRAEAEAAELTVLLLNLDAGNHDYDAVRALIRERQPDLFAAVELTAAWQRELASVLEPYVGRLLEPRESPWGLGLYSRRPLREAKTLLPAGLMYPILTATVEGRTKELRVALLHPEVPGDPSAAARHELFFDVVTAVVTEADSGAVLGDLNTTPWSARYRRLVEDADLEDTRVGYGLQTSWPSFLPAILRIPIDHVLVTNDLAAAERQVGPEVGSDHLPVWVELARRE
jgi:endonuclease/exonuclease/phosphatase (EEP) superfamily protein YafD